MEVMRPIEYTLPPYHPLFMSAGFFLQSNCSLFPVVLYFSSFTFVIFEILPCFLLYFLYFRLPPIHNATLIFSPVSFLSFLVRLFPSFSPSRCLPFFIPSWSLISYSILPPLLSLSSSSVLLSGCYSCFPITFTLH